MIFIMLMRILFILSDHCMLSGCNVNVCDLDNDVIDSNTVSGRHIVTLVSSVSDNMKKYSTREVPTHIRFRDAASARNSQGAADSQGAEQETQLSTWRSNSTIFRNQV